jgi:hypothetical protein
MDADATEAMIALCLHTQRLLLETAEIRQQSTCARQQARTLTAQSQAIHPDAAWAHCTLEAPASVAELPTLATVALESDPLAKEKLALHMIRSILEDFPIEQQLRLIKVLAVRTTVVAHDRLRTATTLSA